MTTHIITIGIPDRCLSPNSRKHWATVSAAKKKLRQTVTDVVRFQHFEIYGKMWEHASVQYHFYFDIERTRDDDNYSAMMKAARDALSPPSRNKHGQINGAGASVVADDCGITQLPTLMGIDRENPRVEIHLTRTETKPVKKARKKKGGKA